MQSATPATKLGPLALPGSVISLLELELADFAEQELQTRETELRKAWAPLDLGMLCQAYASLDRAGRRLELGSVAASQYGFFQNPGLMPPWLWDCLFPTPYRAEVGAAASRQGLKPPLLYALMRQESGFRAKSVSSANAQGLLQLIPNTAQRVAAALGREQDAVKLFQPQTNIEFGGYYIAHLQKQFGHPALAIAAYNAGPHALGRLAHSSIGLPLELFILRIPFRETRGYVQRVLGNLDVYSNLYPELGALEVPLEIPEFPSSDKSLNSPLGEPDEDGSLAHMW
jgi:soluble lytic murein transglycosylase